MKNKKIPLHVKIPSILYELRANNRALQTFEFFEKKKKKKHDLLFPSHEYNYSTNSCDVRLDFSMVIGLRQSKYGKDIEDG